MDSFIKSTEMQAARAADLYKRPVPTENLIHLNEPAPWEQVWEALLTCRAEQLSIIHCRVPKELIWRRNDRHRADKKSIHKDGSSCDIMPKFEK